jgi:hypothetical protein
VLTKGDLPDVAPEAIDSTLVEDIVAETAIAPPTPAAAVAGPAEEAAEPPAAVEPMAEAEEPADVVQQDAGPEALEQVETEVAEPVAEPEVPPMEEEQPVQASADAEATEEGR